MQHLYPGVVWRKPIPGKKVVYLTFDDGPIPEATPLVLDILAQYDVKATFFMVGDNIRKYPQIYDRVLKEGHGVGNHTFHHSKGLRLTTDEYMTDVHMFSKVHAQPCLLFRPPYGRIKPSQKKALLNLGFQIILWDVLTHDYNPHYSPERMFDIVRRYTRNGSIINFHDSVKSADRLSKTLSNVIPWLKKEGYELRLM